MVAVADAKVANLHRGGVMTGHLMIVGRCSACGSREFGNNGVVKFPGEAAERVARTLLEQGPASAGDLAERLGMTAAAVRRPLAALVDAGLAVGGARAPYGPAPVRRRGRPGLVYSLTPAGRSALSAAYDDLALEALRFVARTQGEAGIAAFARDRAERLVERLPTGATDPVQAIADALTDAGYAATVEGEHAGVVQLCQHHCPVVDAAAEFPALCEAETAALGRALGQHVTRLATLAKGDGVCTTVIAGSPARKVPA